MKRAAGARPCVTAPANARNARADLEEAAK